MLNTVDLEAKLGKDEYREGMRGLDARLGQLQRDLRAANIPAIVVFEGWEAAGKGVVLGRLLEALDPRGYKVHNITQPSEDERFRPAMWRFWGRTPARGAIAIFNRSWYEQVLEDRVEERPGELALVNAYERIREFERQLADDGAVIVKFFLHISEKEQAKRFKKMLKDPAFAWKVNKDARRQHKKYKKYFDAVEDMVHETSSAQAPWTLISGMDERLSIFTVAKTLVETFEQALAHHAEKPEKALPVFAPRHTEPLELANLDVAMSMDEYEKTLPALQKELNRLQHLCYVHRRPVVILYEGWDAAGKGGNIRRVIRSLDPRGYEVIPIAAPQGDEKTHHYLWRFWSALPKAGHFAIFDRTWYGRVLVERVEGFARPDEWMRAYSEINEFEQQLAEFGAVVAKFWLHISKEEQLARFEARQKTLEKQWKITEEDWRNREKWDAYWEAVSDMIDRTSTAHAPWTIIEGNDKLHARVKTLRTLVERITRLVPDVKE
jgi:polyphosphate:AMP phosphotransferase